MKISEAIQTARESIKHNFPLLMKGSPGIGKSDIVEQAAKAEDMDLIIRHPVIEESIDYKGLPGFDKGTAKFFPFDDFHQLLTAKKPLAVFFDDLGQAPASVQAALMQVILARQIGGKTISKNVRFIAATNSRKDNAGVSNLITPLVSRFTVVEAVADVNDWIKWALQNGMPIELIAFLRFRPQLISTFDPAKQKDITPFACPRSIAQLGKWLNAGIQTLEVWEGAAGEAFAVEFKAFYDTFKALAGLPDKVIANPKQAPIPDNPATLFALVGALAHRANDVSFPNIAEYGERLQEAGKGEFSASLMIDATTRKPELLESRPWIAWTAKNQEAI